MPSPSPPPPPPPPQPHPPTPSPPPPPSHPYASPTSPPFANSLPPPNHHHQQQQPHHQHQHQHTLHSQLAATHPLPHSHFSLPSVHPHLHSHIYDPAHPLHHQLTQDPTHHSQHHLQPPHQPHPHPHHQSHQPSHTSHLHPFQLAHFAQHATPSAPTPPHPPAYHFQHPSQFPRQQPQHPQHPQPQSHQSLHPNHPLQSALTTPAQSNHHLHPTQHSPHFAPHLHPLSHNIPTSPSAALTISQSFGLVYPQNPNLSSSHSAILPSSLLSQPMQHIPSAQLANPGIHIAPERRVLIVGAGVSGLSCANYLQNCHPNIRVTVLEARQRPGGRVFTHWLDYPDSVQHAPTSSPPDPPSSHNPALPYSSYPSNPLSAPSPAHIYPNQPPFASSGPFVNGTSDAFTYPSSTSNTLGLPRRHDFHKLISAPHHSRRATPDGTPLISVDIGASIMHGCGDPNQLVFERAIHDRIRAPIVAGGGCYESTEHAIWYNPNTGRRIPFETVVDVHNIYFMASRYMAAVASQSDDGATDMESIFDCGVTYVCHHLNRTLTTVERAMLKNIAARSVGYCAPMQAMALMQASAGMEPAGADAMIGVPHEEDDPPFPAEVPNMTPAYIRQQAQRVEKSVMATQYPPRDTIASRRGGVGDRIVLDGYTPFLVDKLCAAIDIRYGKVVCAISKGHCAPKARSMPSAPSASDSHYQPRTAWDDDPEVATRTVLVSTRCGELYDSDVVVVAVPLGVLQRKLDEGGIMFSPSLSEDKLEAVHGMGMGIHNKIVLRFSEDDVFWAAQTPQLNCIDERFQFFNLHAYGKTGVLLVHVFAESGFAAGYWNLSDPGVLYEVMVVLGGIYCGGLESEGAQAGRSRLAKLLQVCENCSKDLNVAENGQVCRHCGRSAEEKKPVSKARDTTANDGKEEEFAKGKKHACWDSLPLPEEYLVTRWDEDPFAFGSYSFMPCGGNWSMIEELATPEPRDCAHPYMFFAGEHCSDLGWQCLHGAYETGIRAAKEILACFGIADTTDGNEVKAMMETEVDGENVGATVGEGMQPKPEGSLNLIKTESMVNNGVNTEDVGETITGMENCSNACAGTGVVGVGVNADLDAGTSAGADAGLTTSGDGDLTATATAAPAVPDGTNLATEGAGVENTANGGQADGFWTVERERALTRALTGYSDVYGNVDDVIDEIAYALETFKKEPTQLKRDEIRRLVQARTMDRMNDGDLVARTFVKFHREGGEEVFPKPFEEVHRRARMIGLNGNKLKEYYADDIVSELRKFAKAVAENQISYRETLRKIAVMIYRKDGGLMTKRCLSEYLRTQEFGTGPQKELYLEKYLPSRPKDTENNLKN